MAHAVIQIISMEDTSSQSGFVFTDNKVISMTQLLLTIFVAFGHYYCRIHPAMDPYLLVRFVL